MRKNIPLIQVVYILLLAGRSHGYAQALVDESITVGGGCELRIREVSDTVDLVGYLFQRFRTPVGSEFVSWRRGQTTIAWWELSGC